MSEPSTPYDPQFLGSDLPSPNAHPLSDSEGGATLPTTISTNLPPISAMTPQAHQRSSFSPTTWAILHFHHTGAVVTLRLPKAIILGRGTSSDVDERLDLTEFGAYQFGVSRAHCQLNRSKYNLMVTDLGSANGTFINGERLYPHTNYNIEHGDLLRLGSFEITVLFSNTSAR